jgi:hypothetical protein
MPRKQRVSVVGIAEHVIQRGNNKQIIFAHDSDMKAYVVWLREYADELNSKVVKDIREAANKGLALGSESFIARVEKPASSR